MKQPVMTTTFSLLVVWSQPGLGQNESRFEPRHVAKLQSVTAASVSPDGGQIAYLVSVPRQPLEQDNGPAWSELHVCDVEGQSRPFITGEVSIGTPSWSPSGDAIFYTAKRNDDEEPALYRIPINGGESQRVVSHDTAIGMFDLSPDGTQVAFLAKDKLDESVEELQDKGFNQEIYEEDWRPNRVWIAELDSQSNRGESSQKPRALELSGSASSVGWSPSGQELMVVLAPTPSVDDSYMRKRVYVVDAESSRVIRSINNPGKLGQVAWSPNGKRLAMVSAVDAHDPQEGRLMVIAVDEEDVLSDLLPDLDAHVTSIEWKNDTSLYWLADDGTGSRFGEVTLGRQREDLIQPGETVLSHFSSSDDGGTLAFVGQAAQHPAELFVSTEETESPQRLTNSNPWLDAMRFADQEVTKWTARDGLELEGVLMYPLNYVAGRRYPTIMVVHGGPESHESNGWLTSYTRPGQVAAARGFAVFYPNYRGSTGRGVEFSKLGQADAAGREFDDLVDGIQALVERGVADVTSVGVTGGSYGGYASAWCSTYYSEHFAASVMFVGISDNVSKVGTTDIPEEMYLVHHRKRLWDDYDYFLERSPIRYVERNRTPTLILHGKDDPRVHPSQSLELFRHLKTLDQAPVRLVLYEGEGHGNRNAAARLDYNLRMLRWMEHYLQGDGGEPPELKIDYREALQIEADE